MGQNMTSNSSELFDSLIGEWAALSDRKWVRSILKKGRCMA
jgi:hypothetical protein